jgi:hypothetical protein
MRVRIIPSIIKMQPATVCTGCKFSIINFPITPRDAAVRRGDLENAYERSGSRSKFHYGD